MRTFIVTICTLLFLSTFPAAAYVNPATSQPHAGTVLRSFDKPARNWLPGHRGVDLPLTPGENVVAASSGTVAFAGNVAGTPTISIDHPDGVRTTYQPVHPWVTTGTGVSQGDIIGILGHPTTGFPGLQWGARLDGEYINPLRLLPRPTIRLKPSAEPIQ
jgi:Membrane proteins related to metalloendopeptidases